MLHEILLGKMWHGKVVQNESYIVAGAKENLFWVRSLKNRSKTVHLLKSVSP